MNETVLSRLAGLKKASTTELRDLWTRYFDSEAPGYNRRFLESRIAYRIQELALGTLSRQTVARLEALGEELDGGKKAVREVSVRGRLVTGTQIVREYQGAEHRVTVLEDGFEYAGKPLDKAFVARVLRNRVYLGEALHKGVSYPGEHEAIIDMPLWEKVEKILAINPGTRSRQNSAVVTAFTAARPTLRSTISKSGSDRSTS